MSKRKDKNPAFSAAKVIPDLCGDPSIEKEIKYGMGKIEVNDNAELRELLSKAIKRLEHVTGCDMHMFHHDATSCDGKISTGECRHKRTCELIFEARKAIAKPQRNCDVGTADEQAKRLDAFCDSHGHGFDGQKCYSCENCKLISIDRCELAWAQMAYTESDAGK